MATLEKEIEEKLRVMVTRHGGLCLKWVCPGWAGVPDRIILLPGGVVMFVELKRPKGSKASPMQVWWARRLRGLGFFHRWVKSLEDVASLEGQILAMSQAREEVDYGEH